MSAKTRQNKNAIMSHHHFEEIVRMNRVFRDYGLWSVPLGGPEFFKVLTFNVEALNNLIQELALSRPPESE